MLYKTAPKRSINKPCPKLSSKSIIFFLTICLGIVVLSGWVGAMMNKTEYVRIMQSDIPLVLSWQNTTYGSYYEGSFSYGSTPPTANTRSFSFDNYWIV